MSTCLKNKEGWTGLLAFAVAGLFAWFATPNCMEGKCFCPALIPYPVLFAACVPGLFWPAT
jgi:hypothetical protein